MDRERTGRAPRIGLALSSGGARGFAHVGVIKALHQAGLNVVGVAGSSMGSIMAAGYAIRGDIEELERWVLAFRARDHARRGLPIMDAERITDFFDTILGGARFADCALPLAIVATDLERGEPATLTAGPLALAAYASMAMPFLHRPVRWEGRLLAEGSLSCVLPLAQARQVRDATVDLVIGSMVGQEWGRLDDALAGLSRTAGRITRGWRRQYADFFRARNLHLVADIAEPAPPTIVVAPDLARVGVFDFAKAKEAIAAGERAALAKLGEIKALLGFA